MQLLSCALLLLVSAAVCYTAQAANYTWVITAGQRSPDCVTKDVILVNNEYMPTLDLTQGEEVEIKVTNALPANWPDVSNGISIHWHGFKMKTYNWYDGVAHVSQCPIKRGSSFTYHFKVNETPGTYFWHDHAGMNRADGLQGAMIVRPANGTKELYSYDDERTLFVMDLWHLNANAMGMRLNRPFDDDKATNATGAWYWVGLPKSVLINGKGHYNDCEDVYKRVNGSALPTGAIATAADLMTPPAKAGALGPTAAFPTCNVTSFANTESTGMCEHESIDVVPGKTYLFRVINAATQVYQTHCFEKHNVTVVAVDGNPVAPQTFSECVDVNSGQRLDVLLTTDQPADNYWITVTAQYRKGAPSGYAVLHYSSAPAMALPAAGSHPLLQPQDGDKKKWTPAVTLSLQAHPVLLNPITAADKTAAAPYLDGYESQSAPTNITRRFVLTTTQPLLEANGVLRWAVNNVVHAKNPSCGAMLSEVAADNDYAAKNAMKNDYDGVTGYFPVGSLEGDGKGVQVFDGSVRPEDELVKAKTPKAGTHVISLKAGEVVEVVLQNFRAGAFGGEYNETSAATFNRTGREQHPWHIHGYRMWLVGSGSGEWNESMVSTYNTKTPVLRDTVTLFADANLTITGAAGWTAFRFVADNPGVWPLHCHISWHQFMGQVVYFIVEPSEVNAPPKDLPVCDGVCRYNFASWTPALTNAAYPNNPLLAPPASGFATSNGRRLMRHTTA